MRTPLTTLLCLFTINVTAIPALRFPLKNRDLIARSAPYPTGTAPISFPTFTGTGTGYFPSFTGTATGYVGTGTGTAPTSYPTAALYKVPKAPSKLKPRDAPYPRRQHGPIEKRGSVTGTATGVYPTGTAGATGTGTGTGTGYFPTASASSIAKVKRGDVEGSIARIERVKRNASGSGTWSAWLFRREA